MALSKMLFASPDSEDMKFFSVKSNASAATGEFSTPPESPTIKTKEPRTSSSSAEGSVDSGATPAAEIYWNSEPEMDLSDVQEETKRFASNSMTLTHSV